MKRIIPQIKLKINNNFVSFAVSNGWVAEFTGADFPQIVDDNLKIHTPINDITTILSFKCKKGTETVEKDCKLHIAGKYGKPSKKPNVIPEPAQWHAFSGIYKELNTYNFDDELSAVAMDFASEYYTLIGKKLEKSNNADVHFSFNESLSYIGKEGYEIECNKNGVKVNCFTSVGAIWAGKTICQLMLQGGFPYGIMRDYPRYSVRGFMLDVGRQPFSMEGLKKVVEKMSFFKMNDFQVHLNDNYIFLEDYAENGDESAYNAYSAFRLESSIKNENGQNLTASDYYYSKNEFRQFIEWSKTKGVNITPEIDVPAHALSITKIFPQYAVRGKFSPLKKSRPLTDHIDISNPDAFELVKRIFDEYTKGENPVFPAETTVHIGADEFLCDYTAYRNFINEFVPYIKKSNPVRLWGGLTWIKDKPTTPINKNAIDNVQMNLWNCKWADGKEMYDMGFKLINTIDCFLYMVPRKSNIRAPYMDFINKKRVFRHFFVDKVKLKNGKYFKIPKGSKQIIGSCYAIWMDNIDKRSKGVSEDDIYIRFLDAISLMAEKNWGSCHKNSSTKIDKAVAKIFEKCKN